MKYSMIYIYIVLFVVGCDNNDLSDYESPNTDCNNSINTYEDYTGLCCPEEEKDCNDLCYGLDFTTCNPCNDTEAINYVEGSSDNNNCIYDPIDDGWVISWNDEFNTEILDNYRWMYQLGTGSQYGLDGWGNNEAQYYTDEIANLNFDACDNDKNCLFINSYKQDYMGSEYTSARIRSIRTQAYGRIDIRAKLPTADGTWPALWMLPHNPSTGWPASGEIDIMEHVGCDLASIHGSIHCTNYNHQDGTGETGYVSNINVTDFNIYRIDWDETSIKWYVNDTLYFQYDNDNVGFDSWPFDEDFYLIMNLAIGGDWGTLGGSCPIDYNSFPQSMVIDYVRVFQEENINE